MLDASILFDLQNNRKRIISASRTESLELHKIYVEKYGLDAKEKKLLSNQFRFMRQKSQKTPWSTKDYLLLMKWWEADNFNYPVGKEFRDKLKTKLHKTPGQISTFFCNYSNGSFEWKDWREMNPEVLTFEEAWVQLWGDKGYGIIKKFIARQKKSQFNKTE
jgi:hypothetical protein